jgi:hypothetical protein
MTTSVGQVVNRPAAVPARRDGLIGDATVIS